MRRAKASRTPQGFSLIECMIALVVLAIGIVALWRTQVFALYSDQGARASIRAQELARELASSLMRLDPLDARLTAADTGEMPEHFGMPFATDAHWTMLGSSDVLPGVTPSDSLERDPLDLSQPLYKRGWWVWQMESANPVAGLRLVAVTVTWHEVELQGARSFTLVLQAANPGAFAANAAAYR